MWCLNMATKWNFVPLYVTIFVSRILREEYNFVTDARVHRYVFIPETGNILNLDEYANYVFHQIVLFGIFYLDIMLSSQHA